MELISLCRYEASFIGTSFPLCSRDEGILFDYSDSTPQSRNFTIDNRRLSDRNEILELHALCTPIHPRARTAGESHPWRQILSVQQHRLDRRKGPQSPEASEASKETARNKQNKGYADNLPYPKHLWSTKHEYNPLIRQSVIMILFQANSKIAGSNITWNLQYFRVMFWVIATKKKTCFSWVRHAPLSVFVHLL
jgi:hypothetical protein